MHNPIHLPRNRALRWSLLFAIFILFILLIRQGQVAFDSRITGVRAPYLQLLGQEGVTLRWNGERMERGWVRYGASPGQLDHILMEPQAATQHELRIEGLKPGRKYYYAAGEGDLESWPADASRWFVTAPESDSEQPLRLWVIGDPGYAHAESDKVRAAASRWLEQHQRAGRPEMDLWFTTGDNAYRSGSNEQFQLGLFEPYASWLRHQPLWPIYGNHDARRNAFFDIFSLPERGELGGIASGSEHYYSFDYGQLHVVVLDSEASAMGRYDPMQQWLKADLLLNSKPWTIAFLHHPPYTKGGHDSDSERDSGGRMQEVRQGLLPMLEKGGVDLVLSGHSHVYERSHLSACHYGDSTSLTPGMVLDRGGEGGNHYHKAPGPWQGTLYAVVGSSAKLDHGPLDHPVMARALSERGSLVVDIDAKELRGVFINAEGGISDRFILSKDLPQPRPVQGCQIPEASAAW